MVNSYSLSDDSGVMAAAAITHFLFGQAVFSYLNGWSVLIGLVQVWTAGLQIRKGFNGHGGVHGFYRDVSVQGLLIISWLGGSRHTMTVRGSRDFPSKNDKVLWRPRRPWPQRGILSLTGKYPSIERISSSRSGNFSLNSKW